MHGCYLRNQDCLLFNITFVNFSRMFCSGALSPGGLVWAIIMCLTFSWSFYVPIRLQDSENPHSYQVVGNVCYNCGEASKILASTMIIMVIFRQSLWWWSFIIHYSSFITFITFIIPHHSSLFIIFAIIIIIIINH